MRLPIALLAAIFAAPCAGAQLEFHVNSTDDEFDASPGDGICLAASGKCSLRAAFMEAYYRFTFHSDSATVYVPAGTYKLTIARTGDDKLDGDLDVGGSLSVIGDGAATTILDANHIDRAVKLDPLATLVVQGMTIRNGLRGSTTPAPQGGAIYGKAGSTMQLYDCVLEDNATESNDAVESNNGGAIFSDGTVYLFRCVFQRNASNKNGGALYLTYDALISDSTIRNNTASVAHSGNGGGIYATGSVSIYSSTFHGNQAYDGGAVLGNAGSTVRLVNSTLTENRAAFGGGLRSFGTAYLSYVTAVRNVANTLHLSGAAGGGIYQSGSVELGIWSSIVASNTNDLDGSEDDVTCSPGSRVGTNGYAILQWISVCPVDGAVQTTAIPLGPLADNGGLTRTIVPGAAAIDVVPAPCGSEVGPLETDQRGSKRPLGTACDLGALEGGPKGDVNGDGFVNVSDILYLINFLFAAGWPPIGIANVNGDQIVSVADVLYLINLLFAGGPAPL